MMLVGDLGTEYCTILITSSVTGHKGPEINEMSHVSQVTDNPDEIRESITNTSI